MANPPSEGEVSEVNDYCETCGTPLTADEQHYNGTECEICSVKEKKMTLRDTVLALFCDPEGNPCFHGSEGDRQVLRKALEDSKPPCFKLQDGEWVSA